MNTSRKLSVLLAAAGLFTAARASGQATFTWTGASATTNGTAITGDWTVPANWTPAGPPTSATTTTVIIDDTTAKTANAALTSQTVQYNITAGGGTIGTLNLLNGAGAGFTDTLQLTSTGTSSTTTRLTVANAITLGTATGTVEIRLSPTAASATSVLSAAQGLTVNLGGLVTLDASASTTGIPIVNANTTINNGGTLSVLGSSAAGGIGVNTGNANTLTLNSGGLITFNATGTSTTGRLQLFGNFTTTGGTITGSTNTTGANQIELYGATNTIGANTTFTSTGGANTAAVTFSLRTAGQTLTSASDLPNVLVRSGTAASPVNLVLTGGQNVSLLTLGTAAGYLKLGSNVNTPAVPVISITGSTLDLNGFALTSSATTGTFTPIAGSALSSSQANGTLSVPTFNFGTGATVNTVGANVTVVANGVPGNAAALTSTAGTATFSPTSTLAFTGNSTAAVNNRLVLVGSGAASTLGNLQVGSGTSTTFLQLQAAPFALQGNLNVLANSTIDMNTRSLTVAGKVQGTGAITSVVTGGVLTFSSAGGLAPGFNGGTGVGSVGSLTLTGTSGFQALTLIGTSVSNFDLASAGSFDSLIAGANTVTINGSLVVNLIGGYTPAAGTSWNIFTGLGAGSAGTFSSITDGAGGSYSFSISGTNGVLTAVPEPSTWVMGVITLACLIGPVRRTLRKRSEA